MIDRFYAAKTAASAVARPSHFAAAEIKVPKSPRENAPKDKDRLLFETRLCKTLGTTRIIA